MENQATDTKIVNLDYVNMVCGGSEEMVTELINLFLEQTPSEVEKMHESFEKKDWDGLNSAAHKTKSSTNILGIDQIKDDITSIEVWAAERKNLDQIQPLIEKVDAVCHKAYQELNENN